MNSIYLIALVLCSVVFQDVKAQKKKFAMVYETIDALEVKCNDLIAGLQVQITSNDGEITTLTDNLQTAINNVDANTAAISTSQGDITTLQSSVASNDGDISNLETDLTELTGTVNTHTNSISTLQGDLADCKTTVETYTNKKVAFYASRWAPIINAKKWKNIKFPLVITNQGDAYNRSTGEFIVPFDGTYHCDVTITTRKGMSFETALKVNGKNEMKIYSAGNSQFHNSGSGSCNLELTAGDIVMVRRNAAYGQCCPTLTEEECNIVHGNKFSFFACHLVSQKASVFP